MGYMSIKNLYKNKSIFLFKRCFAMEKIHGCLKKGTKILLWDKSEKNIENIKTGDETISFDINKKKFIKSIVKNLLIQETNTSLGWIKITISNKRSITCTEDHPFLTQRGWIKAAQLTLEDDLVAIDEKFNTIE